MALILGTEGLPYHLQQVPYLLELGKRFSIVKTVPMGACKTFAKRSDKSKTFREGGLYDSLYQDIIEFSFLGNPFVRSFNQLCSRVIGTAKGSTIYPREFFKLSGDSLSITWASSGYFNIIQFYLFILVK